MLWLLEMTLEQQQGEISAARLGSVLVASQTEGGATSLRGAQLRRMDFCGGEALLLVFGEHQEGVRAAEAARKVRWVLALLLHPFSSPLFLLDVLPEMFSGSFPGWCLGACVRPVAVPWCDTRSVPLKRAPGPINSSRHT